MIQDKIVYLEILYNCGGKEPRNLNQILINDLIVNL